MGPLKRVKRVIGKAWLKAFGWEVDGGAPDVAKAVVAPAAKPAAAAAPATAQ